MSDTMKTILFVDDEQFVLDGLSRLLREFRNTWNVRFALNGRDALDIISREQIDMIITDVRMPEMSGLELLEILRSNEETRNLPVVILTGDQERTLKRQALDLGAVDLLNKPINKEDLVSRIKNVLKLKEYQDLIIEKNEALERQLVISQKMELVGVMAAGAVHDLSNLISIIIGYSNLFMEESCLNKEDTLSIGKIREAGEKAAGVVNYILKFSRSEEQFTILNIGDLIDDILSILRVSIPKTMKVLWKKPSEEIYLSGGAVKFQQVLMNLFVNAIQAMGKEGKLKVFLNKVQRGGVPMARIDVEDTGPGMDKETMDKIFNPLFTTKPAGKGTGLGLFVVRHIVELYHGLIEVCSEIGKGTVFTIHFPLDIDTAEII